MLPWVYGRRFLALSRGFFNSCFRLLDIFPLHLKDRGGAETEACYQLPTGKTPESAFIF